MDDGQARQLVTTVEASLERLEGIPPAERAVAHEAIAGICELYGEALRRLLELGHGRDDGSWLVRFARTDELVSHLLLLHGLHPDGQAPLDKLLAEEAAATPPRRASAPGEPELVRLGTGGAGAARDHRGEGASGNGARAVPGSPP